MLHRVDGQFLNEHGAQQSFRNVITKISAHGHYIGDLPVIHLFTGSKIASLRAGDNLLDDVRLEEETEQGLLPNDTIDCHSGV